MNLTEQDVLVNNIKLHVYRTGTNKPPLVFAHGITDNGLCFLPFASRLADDYEIILYDSRGHGKSEASNAETTVIDRARDLAELVEALGLHKPGLFGHSMGAITVALMAGLYPHIPGCIVLEDPPPFEMFAPATEEALLGRKVWHTLAAANKQKSLQELVAMNRQESPNWVEAERLPWAQSKQQFSLTVFDEGHIDIQTGKQIMAQITCPLLLITASLELGALLPAKAADELVASLPVARHVNIPGAGHSIRREQPEAYYSAVRDCLGEFA